MSADWLSIELDLPDKPKVRRIARLLSIDVDTVVGKLIRVWRWFNRVSVDGFVDGAVDADVDDFARHDGFAAAMAAVGWLVIDAEQERIGIPDFGLHNGNSAKKRSSKSERQARWRAKKALADADVNVDAGVDASVDAGRRLHASTTNGTEQNSKSTEQDQKIPTTSGEKPPDPDPIFGHALAFLISKGVKDKGARSFLGSMRKAIGDMMAAELISIAESEDISDPIPWLRKAAENRSGVKTTTSKVMQGLQALERMKPNGKQTDSAAELVLDSDSRRPSAPHVLELGKPTGS